MSGPKYYNFPMKTPEEAAAVLAQLSSLQPGVIVKVVNNELRFTVSNDAWYAGATYSAISDKVNGGLERYRESERLARVLNERKQEEKNKIKAKKDALRSAYRREKAALEEAQSKCRALLPQAKTRVDTPFGSYGLPAEERAVEDASRRIAARLANIDGELKQALEKCDECERDIEGCTALQQVSQVQRKYNSADIAQSSAPAEVNRLASTVQNKLQTLKRFVGFLEELYRNMQNKDLSGYFDRIKAAVAQIDIFDSRAGEKMNAILKQLEDEIKGLRERERAHMQDDDIRRSVSEQISVLTALKESLMPVLDSVDSVSTVRADYTQTANKAISECDDVIAGINSLEFVSGDNLGKVEMLKNRLNELRNSVMSENTVTILQNILRELRTLEKTCKSDADVYSRFKAEQEKYLGLYIRLQGVLSAEGAELDDAALEVIVDPAEFQLVYGDPEKQIERLRELNEQLAARLSECFQKGVCAAFSQSVEKSSWGAKFKEEDGENGDRHMTYVRKQNKGAIFDVTCTKDGRVGIYPRGVMLSNGVPVITPDELRAVHSSCDWADEVTDSVRMLGVDGTSYEEMPKEDLEAMYDLDNYYHIKTEEESYAYLRMCGFPEEEIDRLMRGEEKSEDRSEENSDDIGEEKSGDDRRGISSNATKHRYVDDK